MTEKPKLVPPVYFFVTLLVMGSLHWFLPIKTILLTPFNFIGAPFIVIGVIATLWAANAFRKIGTPVRPFEPSTVLVTKGLYRITRNPMYLGMVVALIGVATLLGTASPFIPIALFVWLIQRGFVRPEEAFLERIFGQEYVAYKARVRRWL